MYRDEVMRVSIADVRTRFRPRVWRTTQRVRLEHAHVVADIELVVIRGAGAIATARRFRCPGCQRPVLVLGCLRGLGWRCRLCARWRSRNPTDLLIKLCT